MLKVTIHIMHILYAISLHIHHCNDEYDHSSFRILFDGFQSKFVNIFESIRQTLLSMVCSLSPLFFYRKRGQTNKPQTSTLKIIFLCRGSVKIIKKKTCFTFNTA